MIELLTTNHLDRIFDQFDSAARGIRIISPFLTRAMTERLAHIVKTQGVSCTFITRLYVNDLLAKANSTEALRGMLDAGIEVYAVKGLHTKLYLFDDTSAVLGSANFTMSGFKSNIELSVLISQEQALLAELDDYFNTLLSRIKAAEWEALGSDTYYASFGRAEDDMAATRKHYQKAHIRLSGNAKLFIDKEFETRKEKYGVKTYVSE